jgi:hypothetical protein
MKIRNGFVSNSSSSSFVYIIKAEKYDEFLSGLDDYKKEIIERLSPKKDVAFGIDVFIISGGLENTSSFDCMRIDAGSDLNESEFKEKFGYERCAEVAFESIPVPDGSVQIEVDM